MKSKRVPISNTRTRASNQNNNVQSKEHERWEEEKKRKHKNINDWQYQLNKQKNNPYSSRSIRMERHIDQDDSSGEEYEKSIRKKYDFVKKISIATKKENFWQSMQNWGQEIFKRQGNKDDLQKITNSFILHTIGKMAISSEEVSRQYRDLKQKYLKPSQKIGRLKDKQLIRTILEEEELSDNALEIRNKIKATFEVSDLTSLLALGRLTRRSQIRKYRNLKEENRAFYRSKLGNIGGLSQQKKQKKMRDTGNLEEVKNKGQKKNLADLYVNFRSQNNKSFHIVRETLVAGTKGLSSHQSKNQQSSENSPIKIDTVHFFPETQINETTIPYQSLYNSNKYITGENVAEQISQVIKEIKENKQTQNVRKFEEGFNDNKKDIEQSKYLGQYNDQHIARLIRRICLGESISEVYKPIRDKIYPLTYLLFKTEVYRSPAALISNMQMLDLIINEKLSFSKAFEKSRIMPMSMSGAIQASRELHRVFYNYKEDSELSYGYFYNEFSYSPQAKKDNLTLIRKLIERESSLMNLWSQFKGIENPIININQVCKKIAILMGTFGLELALPLERAKREPLKKQLRKKYLENRIRGMNFKEKEIQKKGNKTKKTGSKRKRKVKKNNKAENEFERKSKKRKTNNNKSLGS